MKYLIFVVFNIIASAVTENVKIVPAMCNSGGPFYEEDNTQKPTINGTLSALIITNRPCMNNYSSLKVQRNGGIVDLEICYDQISSKTIYAKYEIDGVPLKQSNATTVVPPRPTVNFNLYPDNIACYYTKNHQAALFRNVHKTEGTITESSYLTKGYLACHADFSENYKQLGTFFYANITPKWQYRNQNSWSLIESAIRSFAIDTGKKLEVYAGTHGQMSFAGDPVFLDGVGRRIPVAGWLWKIAVDRQADTGIAFLCSNDPFDKARRPPCGGGHGDDLCDANGWDVLARDRGVFGTYCCTVSELKEAVPEAGDVDDVEYVLDRMALLDDIADVSDDTGTAGADDDDDGELEDVAEEKVIRRPVTVTAASKERPKPRFNVRPRPVTVV